MTTFPTHESAYEFMKAEFARQMAAQPRDYNQPEGLALYEAEQARQAQAAAEPEADEADFTEAAQWARLENAARRREGFVTTILNGSTIEQALSFAGGRAAKVAAERIVALRAEVGGVESDAIADLVIAEALRDTLDYCADNGIGNPAQLHDPASIRAAEAADAEALVDSSDIFSASNDARARQSYRSSLAELTGNDTLDAEIEEDQPNEPTRISGPTDFQLRETTQHSDAQGAKGFSIDGDYDWGNPSEISDSYAKSIAAFDVPSDPEAEPTNALDPQPFNADFLADQLRDRARSESGHWDQRARPS